MDSPRLKKYKQEMARCFSRAIKQGSVAYWDAQRLSADIYDLLRQAQTEFLQDDNWNDLLQFTIAVYRRWSHTEMDDDGGTILIMETLESIWEQLLVLAEETEKKKMFHFLTQYGSKESVFSLEENLWDFLDSHFTEKKWLPKKKTYWEELDAQISQKPGKHDSEHERIHDYLIQIQIDEGATLEEAEKLLQGVSSYDYKHRLARLYRERGEIAKEQTVLEEELKDRYQWEHRQEYRKRLLQIYHQQSETDKEKQLRRTILLEDPGNKEALQAYKNCFSPEEWKTVLEEKLFPQLKDKKEALPLFAREKRYDLLMAASEESGQLPAKWEKTLRKTYPDRCLKLLTEETKSLAARAYNRKGYQWVVRLLRRLAKYDDGTLARQLANQFRQQYANRPAFLEELNWEFPVR